MRLPLILVKELIISPRQFCSILQNSSYSSIPLIQYIQNALIIAVVTAFLGMSFAYLLAYNTVRKQGALAKLVNLLSLSTIAIIGLVLGINCRTKLAIEDHFDRAYILSTFNTIKNVSILLKYF